MKNINVYREPPSLFDELPIIMIGRNIKDKIWKTFNWGDKCDLAYEYAPLRKENKHLIGTNFDYEEKI